MKKKYGIIDLEPLEDGSVRTDPWFFFKAADEADAIDFYLSLCPDVNPIFVRAVLA